MTPPLSLHPGHVSSPWQAAGLPPRGKTRSATFAPRTALASGPDSYQARPARARLHALTRVHGFHVSCSLRSSLLTDGRRHAEASAWFLSQTLSERQVACSGLVRHGVWAGPAALTVARSLLLRSEHCGVSVHSSGHEPGFLGGPHSGAVDLTTSLTRQ